MASKQSFRFLSLDGGLATDVSPILLNPDQGFAVESINLDYSRRGVVRKRPGVKPVLSPVEASPLGCHYFIRASTQKAYHVVAADGVVYKYDSGWTSIKTGLKKEPMDFMTFADSLIMTNGSDTPLKWDGSDVSNLSNFPKTKFIADYRLRIAAAGDSENPSKLYLSHTGDPALWSTTDVSSNAAELFVSPDDGDVITGLCNAGEGGLIIGKQRAIYGLFGYSRTNFMVDILEPNLGCASHKSMRYLRPYVYFVNEYGIFRMDVGSPSEKISTVIQSVFDSRVNKLRLSEARAMQAGENYVLTLPTGVSGFFTLAFNTTSLAWSEWTQPLIFDSWTVANDQESDVYFFAPENLSPYKMTYADKTDNAQEIPTSLVLVESSAGLPEVTKEIHDFYVSFLAGDESYYVDFYLRGDDYRFTEWVSYAKRIKVVGNKGSQVTVRVPVGATNLRYFQVKLEGYGDEFYPVTLTCLYTPQEVL